MAEEEVELVTEVYVPFDWKFRYGNSEQQQQQQPHFIWTLEYDEYQLKDIPVNVIKEEIAFFRTLQHHKAWDGIYGIRFVGEDPNTLLIQLFFKQPIPERRIKYTDLIIRHFHQPYGVLERVQELAWIADFLDRVDHTAVFNLLTDLEVDLDTGRLFFNPTFSHELLVISTRKKQLPKVPPDVVYLKLFIPPEILSQYYDGTPWIVVSPSTHSWYIGHLIIQLFTGVLYPLKGMFMELMNIPIGHRPRYHANISPIDYVEAEVALGYRVFHIELINAANQYMSEFGHLHYQRYILKDFSGDVPTYKASRYRTEQESRMALDPRLGPLFQRAMEYMDDQEGCDVDIYQNSIRGVCISLFAKIKHEVEKIKGAAFDQKLIIRELIHRIVIDSLNPNPVERITPLEIVSRVEKEIYGIDSHKRLVKSFIFGDHK